MEGFNNSEDEQFMGNSLSYIDVYCQADNCTSDLTDAKRYHRRHKVCEFHAKAPVVIVNSKHQRFCQQCSKCVSHIPPCSHPETYTLTSTSRYLYA
ncbi:hypothetical protein SOVF_172970 isoform A [Spinacia oleracea]|nr:hypothetical protein SOVF_172970 isoform A [Spinacia oleracea]